jgi:nitroreductase
MAEPVVVESDFFEVIGTQRAMRRLKTDPVPEEYLKKILWAATRAPSGGNRQGWRWLVVTDAEKKLKIKEWYHELWSKALEGGYGAGANLPPDEKASNERVMRSATYLSEHMHEAPALIFACSLTGNGDITSGSSIYPAVQNLMLAARAHGLGTVLTTVYKVYEDEVRAVCEIPDRYEVAALMPLGHPTGRWGVAARRPARSITNWETFGNRH